MEISTRDQTDGRLVMIGVVIADSRLSSNNDGDSRGRLDVCIEVACFRLRELRVWQWSRDVRALW